MKRTASPTEYWTALKNSSFRPNFWCSEEYWAAAGWDIYKVGASLCVVEGNELMLPNLTDSGKVLSVSCWATLIDQPEGDRPFLDWNYLYRGEDFRYLDGGKWSVFRKNSRKWDWANPFAHWKIGPCDLSLIEAWAGKKETIEDWEALVNCWKNHKSQLHLTNNDKTVAWLCWDENYYATNFRWLLVDPEEPFLDEYCRKFFYQAIRPASIINDGGCLGNSGLERFKDKLNPYQKHPIYGG